MIVVRDRISGETLPGVPETSSDQIESIVAAAANAFPSWKTTDRAPYLEACADALEARRADIVAIAHRESALPLPRLEGELSRTTGQLRFFAGIVRDGAWEDRREDGALPDRQPLPRPSIVSLRRPLGPVLVFGASNFPLAFSTAGGDTASALAAGCPVVVKAHPAHPGTAALVGEALATALPPGVIGQIFETGYEAGQRLAADPRIAAIGFTGSRKAGLALAEIASKRSRPIPVFAEMSAINPSVILPGAMTPAMAKGLAGSVTLGCGQFCTNPGLVLLVGDSAAFETALAVEMGAVHPGAMLTDGIAAAYKAGLKNWEALGAERLMNAPGSSALSATAPSPATGVPALFAVSATQFLITPGLQDEVFGPATLLVRCADLAEARRVLRALEGQLTASVHASSEELETARELLPDLERVAGRVILNQFPTGVEVSNAMVHGGPWPATSAPNTTSVGGRAILRWTRPVAFQNLPTEWI